MKPIEIAASQRPGRRGVSRRRCSLAACGGGGGSGEQGTGPERGRGRVQRRPDQRRQPVGDEGRHAQVRQLRRLGHPRPGRDLLRLLLELRPAVRPLAVDVQGRARQGEQRAGARPRRGPGRGERRTARPGPTRSSKGVKFEDGTEVTSADVKYAVLRSTDKADLPQRPGVLRGHPRPAERLQGSVQVAEREHRLGDRDAGQVHDRLQDQAAVRQLRLPRSADPDTCRCPKAKDTGAKYRNTIVSSGPYKFDEPAAGQELQPGPQRPVGSSHRPEPQGAAGSHTRSASTSTPTTSTTGCISGDLDVDVAGTGVQPAALAGSCRTRRSRRTPTTRSLSRLWYTSINPTVAPFDNIECRKAIMYAHGPDRLPDRVRRPVRRWRPGDDDPAAEHPGLRRPSTSTRTARTTRATSRRPRSRCEAAVSRTASRPTSPTGPSGRRRRPPPRRSSRRCPGSASSSPSSRTRRATTSPSTPATRRSW